MGLRDGGARRRWSVYSPRAMTEPNPIGYTLLNDILALDLQVGEAKIENFGETEHVEIEMTDDPEVLSSCAWGLIFAIGVLSFADARPRGASDMHYAEDDEWTVGDMLRHLRFEHRKLHFYADYVRGRCIKTTVEIDAEGTILLRTVNRGEAATRWVAKLQGKKMLELV